MPFYGILHGYGTAIVQEHTMLAQTPQRHGAHFVAGALASVLNDAVPGSDVMQQKVTIGMEGDAAESCGHTVGSTIDNRSRSRCYKGRGMTQATTCPLKHALTLFERSLTCGLALIRLLWVRGTWRSGWRFGGPHKVGGKNDAIVAIVWLAYRFKSVD